MIWFLCTITSKNTAMNTKESCIHQTITHKISFLITHMDVKLLELVNHSLVTDLKARIQCCSTQGGLFFCFVNWIHPGLAEIPAPVGSQEVVDTPTNAHSWLVGPVLHPAIVWRDNPSVVTSHPGTQPVQDFLLTQGELWSDWLFCVE